MLFLTEGEIRSLSCWKELLSASSEEVSALLQKKVLSPVKTGLKLSFVGEVVCRNKYVICLPKCIDFNRKKSKYYQDITRATIKKYIERNKQNVSVFEEQLEELKIIDDSVAKEYEVFISLSLYFFANGSYKRQVLTTQNNPSKRTYWKKTIQSTVAYSTDNSVFYPNPISKNAIKKSNLITDVFNSTLIFLAKKYAKSDISRYIFESDSSIIPFEKIQKNSAFFCKKIQSELNQTFNTEDLNTLSILMRYISGELSLSGSKAVSARGTSAYHVIWEDICAFLFKSQYGDEIGGFSQPKWMIQDSEASVTYIEKGKLIPDVLWSEEGESYILDAKYYFPFPGSFCGVGDIAKQYIYAEVSNSDHVENCFLFPGNILTPLTYVGSSIMALPDNSIAPNFMDRKIHAIVVDFDCALEAYVNGTNIRYRESLKKVIKEH